MYQSCHTATAMTSHILTGPTPVLKHISFRVVRRVPPLLINTLLYLILECCVMASPQRSAAGSCLTARAHCSTGRRSRSPRGPSSSSGAHTHPATATRSRREGHEGQLKMSDFSSLDLAGAHPSMPDVGGLVAIEVYGLHHLSGVIDLRAHDGHRRQASCQVMRILPFSLRCR